MTVCLCRGKSLCLGWSHKDGIWNPTVLEVWPHADYCTFLYFQKINEWATLKVAQKMSDLNMASWPQINFHLSETLNIRDSHFHGHEGRHIWRSCLLPPFTVLRLCEAGASIERPHIHLWDALNATPHRQLLSVTGTIRQHQRGPSLWPH